MKCFPRVLAFLPHSKWVVPPWGCYLSNFATLLFTTFEISKHPTFPECLIWKVLEPPNYNSKRLNYTTVEWFDPPWGCYLPHLATWLVTTFEIPKHPNEVPFLKFSEPPNANLQLLNLRLEFVFVWEEPIFYPLTSGSKCKQRTIIMVFSLSIV